MYAVMAEGTWRYDAQAHRLELVKVGDLRAVTGLQEFAGSAPLNLVYVADFERMHDVREQDRVFIAGVDSGCIVENVYLYCAGALAQGIAPQAWLAPLRGSHPRTSDHWRAQRIGTVAVIAVPRGQRKDTSRAAATLH